MMSVDGNSEGAPRKRKRKPMPMVLENTEEKTTQQKNIKGRKKRKFNPEFGNLGHPGEIDSEDEDDRIFARRRKQRKKSKPEETSDNTLSKASNKVFDDWSKVTDFQ